MNRGRGILKIFGVLVLGVVALALLIQILPIGKNHTNPAVIAEPAWDSPQTRALAQRACFDCHSNETVWPWYSNIAPVSWLVYRDVQEGRQRMNFSEWGVPRQAQGREREGFESDEVGEVIRDGEMPPMIYLVQHPEAALTGAEKEQLIRGLEASLQP